MSNKEIHGIVEADFNSLKNVSGEEIKGTTKIYVDVPVVPRWLSDILTKFKSESVDYYGFKEKLDFKLIEETDILQFNWIRENAHIYDLAIALGVWVVEDE